jgi:hypothetical protein
MATSEQEHCTTDTVENKQQHHIVGNGPLFAVLNYDIRDHIYTYIMPMRTPEEFWIGYALSCHQAYEELLETANCKVKTLIIDCLAQCEKDSGVHFRLLIPINAKPSFLLLSSVVVAPDPRLDWRGPGTAMLLVSGEGVPEWYYTIKGLRPLYLEYFRYITILDHAVSRRLRGCGMRIIEKVARIAPTQSVPNKTVSATWT